MYWGEVDTIENCIFEFLSDKSYKPKCAAPETNCISIQTVLRRMQNDKIQQLSQAACKVNDLIMIELVIGNILQMNGAIVGELVNKKPTREIEHLLPNFEEELAKHKKDTEYCIEDGGVLPCGKNKVKLDYAECLLLVQ